MGRAGAELLRGLKRPDSRKGHPADCHLGHTGVGARVASHRRRCGVTGRTLSWWGSCDDQLVTSLLHANLAPMIWCNWFPDLKTLLQ